MSELTEWIKTYYGIFILIGMIIILLGWSSFLRFVDKKKKKMASELPPPPPIMHNLNINAHQSNVPNPLFEPLFPEQEGLFEDIRSKDSLNHFQEQKIFAEKQINHIKEEGKKW